MAFRPMAPVARGNRPPMVMKTPRSAEIFLPLDEDEAAIPRLAAQAAGVALTSVGHVEVVRRSLDARKGHPIGWKLAVRLLPSGVTSATSATPGAQPGAQAAERLDPP